ncbi:hypothetical protein BVRB_7g157960 [Beta vulgaris subsp. vulgaris]|nr:hypothetical protein BVRB_7g157960 [Beta vulgaris subsp. vulgaris]
MDLSDSLTSKHPKSDLILTASQASDIQFLDARNRSNAYLTIDAHRG